MTKKEMASIKKQIIEELEPLICGEEYYLDTKFGEYIFWFDEDSIFGRFSDVKKLQDGMKDVDKVFEINGVMWELKHVPNEYSGKFNFHYNDCHDFVNTLDRMLAIHEKKKDNEND